MTAPKANDEATQLLRQVGLDSVGRRRVGERRIGTGARGISGGERRRLAVACAIAGEDSGGASEGAATVGSTARPRAIFADEPTTGLDAFQAERVVKLLRSLAVCSSTRGVGVVGWCAKQSTDRIDHQ